MPARVLWTQRTFPFGLPADQHPELLERLRGTPARVEAYAPEDFARVSNHPRLGTPMRLVDMMAFHAEHDDHHLARMREVAGTLCVP